jgi:hypothetical protein
LIFKNIFKTFEGVDVEAMFANNDLQLPQMWVQWMQPQGQQPQPKNPMAISNPPTIWNTL